MSNKIKFYWCIGSGYLGIPGLDIPGLNVAVDADLIDQVPDDVFIPGQTFVTAGLNGQTAIGGPKAIGVFGQLLDPEIFEFEPVLYPASWLGMGPSVLQGVQNVAAKITDPNRPKGQKFMLGGASQGAAVMAGIYEELRYGSLTDYNQHFLGYVGFGSPRRQLNYRGSVGGTWSGAWDIPGSTAGGHGAFPATGPLARLQNCEPERWIEFVYPDDVFSGVGDSAEGQAWQTAVAAWVSMSPLEFATYLANPFVWSGAVGLTVLHVFTQIFPRQTVMTDALGQVWNVRDQFNNPTGGPQGDPTLSGHNTQSAVPIGNPDNGLTCLQIGLKFALAKATEYSVSPLVLPSLPTTPTAAGWSTTLLPPAA